VLYQVPHQNVARCHARVVELLEMFLHPLAVTENFFFVFGIEFQCRAVFNLLGRKPSA
jgi:hypothetical protein